MIFLLTKISISKKIEKYKEIAKKISVSGKQNKERINIKISDISKHGLEIVVDFF